MIIILPLNSSNVEFYVSNLHLKVHTHMPILTYNRPIIVVESADYSADSY